MNKKLTLIGAGPGDPELISIKGLKALQKADVILYDALVNPELLDFANKSTIIKFVGKRCSHTSFTQEDINQLIVLMAEKYGHVVRLKGGDPFVFARGYEEIEFATLHGLECESIPGISSAISLNHNFLFPITHRDIARNFSVYTATNSSNRLNPEFLDNMNNPGTKIILMGFRKLPSIVDAYLQSGFADLPIAIIQNGTCKNEKAVFGVMSNILILTENAGIGTPAVIYIGKTIGLKTTSANEKQSIISYISQS